VSETDTLRGENGRIQPIGIVSDSNAHSAATMGSQIYRQVGAVDREMLGTWFESVHARFEATSTWFPFVLWFGKSIKLESGGFSGFLERGPTVGRLWIKYGEAQWRRNEIK
jgi:hypothetical protein